MKIKCPVCGNVFEGPVAFCPSCGAKLQMPDSVPAAPVAQAVAPVAPVPDPAQAGSKGKAIGFGIPSLLLGLPAFFCEMFMIIVGAVGAYAAGKTGPLTGFEQFAGTFTGLPALFALCGLNFVFGLLAMIFGIVSAKQKMVKGLAVTAKTFGILAFVFNFVSAIVYGICFGIVWATIITATL